MGDGILESNLAVQIGLPVDDEETRILLPTALGEFFAESRWDGGGSVAQCGDVIVPRIFRCGALEDRAEHLAGGEEDQGMPEVARDRFVTLAALAGDGGFDGAGDIVRGLVKEDLESFGALVAWIGAGDGDAEGVESGVGPGGVCEGADFHADFLFGPLGLVDVREAFGEADALFADEWSDADDPAAVGAVVVGPPVCAVDGCGGLQDDTDITGEPGVAGGLRSAGELAAILKVTELVLQEDQVDIDEQVFGGVVRSIVRDSLIPDALFRGGESGLRAGRQLQHGPGRLGGGVPRVFDGFAGPCLVIEEMVEIDPEAAMKLKDGQGAINGFDLLSERPGSSGRKQAEGKEKENAKRGEAHIGNGNVSVFPGCDERNLLQNS